MGVKKNITFNQIHSCVYTALNLWKLLDIHRDDVLSQFKDEASNLEELLKRTFHLGESNSILVIGPRGCGKTALLNAVLSKLKDAGTLKLGLVVKLSGLLQTDDKLALKEFAKQLNVNEENSCKFASFAENLNYVLKIFNDGSRELSKPIICLLDEFDLFCHHHNQTLLYNLFDVAQSSQAPICVVGLTARLDVIELLEKRVKSRFSHRQIFLYPPDDFDFYLNVAESFLRIKDDSIALSENGISWNDSVEELFRCSEVTEVLKNRFRLYRDFRTLKTFLSLVMAQLTGNDNLLKLSHFKEAHKYATEEAKMRVIESLSILQLSLLISMKHVHTIYDGEPFNFEMVYRQYSKFGERHSSMIYERPVVFKAFDQLECLELIRSADQSRSSMQREYRLMQLLVTPNMINEVIQNSPNLPTFLVHWCSSDVV